MPIHRSQLSQLAAPDAFLWATGIEDTFIADPWPRTGRTMDEYALTQHYERWESDLDLMASLGVNAARYGIPWYRIQPEPNRWDWTWADGPLERLLERGIMPIVDLVHYGTPAWLEGSFLHPDYPRRVAEYAAEVASRFKGRIHWYTPLNEPRVNAWFSGRLGWWPPYRRGWQGFSDVLLPICRGIVETDRALRAVDPEIVLTHVDPGDLYATDDPALANETAVRQELVFLALDLINGKMDDAHALYPWLRKRRVTLKTLDWFQENAIEADIMGVNLYPMMSQKRILRHRGVIRERGEYATAELLERLAAMYWQRYKRPIMVTETATAGPVEKRLEWLNDSVAAVQAVRRHGVPVVGYTWWPMFALINWTWRQGNAPLTQDIVQMGLWDLDAAMNRVETPVVAAYREAVRVTAIPPIGPVV